MSVDDARTAAPNWSPLPNQLGVVQVRVRGAPFVGGSYNLRLNFEAGRLLNMRAERTSHEETEQSCWDGFTALVGEAETHFGLLDSQATNPIDAEEIRELPSGSRIVFQRGPNDRYRQASAWRKEPHISVSAFAQAQEQQVLCMMSASAALDSLWEELVPATPAPDDIATAPFSGAVLRPGHDSVWRFYPRAPMYAELEGRVELHCLVIEAGPPRCAVVREAPRGLGFGEAALRIAERSSVASEHEGEPTAGKRIRSVIQFRLSD